MTTLFDNNHRISPCFSQCYSNMATVNTVTLLHTTLTRAEHNELVSMLRTHIENFINTPILLPYHLLIAFSIYERKNLYKILPTIIFKTPLGEQNIAMREYLTAFLDQCDTIIPIVFADEEGAVS